MPGKHTEGYTKSAQQQKFIRHRDVKLKESEIAKEARIQREMCDGVCPRCRDKVQWRFKYDKYKPLKNVGNCQACRKKCVTKAYRTLCDACAASQGVCSSCCTNMADAIAEREARNMELEKSRIQKDLPDDDNRDIVMSSDDARIVHIVEGEDSKMELVSSMENIDSILKSGTSDWDGNKFSNIAVSKYSKKRLVGSIEDTIFVFPHVDSNEPL
jgi:hypothetical protein